MTLGALRYQLKSLDTRLADLEGEAKTQTEILTTLARQDARLDGLDTRFNDLMTRLGRNPRVICEPPLRYQARSIISVFK